MDSAQEDQLFEKNETCQGDGDTIDKHSSTFELFNFGHLRGKIKAKEDCKKSQNG